MTILLFRKMGGKYKTKLTKGKIKCITLSLLSSFYLLFFSFSMKQRLYCYTSLFEKNVRKERK